VSLLTEATWTSCEDFGPTDELAARGRSDSRRDTAAVGIPVRAGGTDGKRCWSRAETEAAGQRDRAD